ncbi:MAG TPA: hypothetical protein DC054_01755 [Blastocatellia bacterium]|nr:hypothetical protein [Blastocatellia bacterium]
MRTASQKRFFPVPLLMLLIIIGAVGLSAIPTRHLWEGSAHGRTQKPSKAGTRPQPRPTPYHCSSCPPPSPRRIYAPAIELPEAGECKIVLNSRSPHPIDVTPTLYTVDGEQVTGKAVTLQPAEIRFVPIKSLMPDTYNGKHRWGGIALSYTGGILEVWAQITFQGVGRDGSIDETFNLFEDQGSDTREAVWSMPEGSRAVIALGNSSDTSIQTTAQFSNGESEVVNIAPFATEFVRRAAHEGQGKDASSESVKLTTVGPAGSLRVAGFVLGGDQSFNSAIRFADTKKVAQPNLYATNLRLGDDVPHMLIENTSDSGVSARPKFFPATGAQGNQIELPEIILAPRQIVDVDLRPLTEAASTCPDLNSVSVEVLNSGAAGSLIGALYSTDKVKRLRYDVPLRDSGAIRNSTGSYPWRVDDDYTTIVNITNISDHTASFLVDIRFLTGHYFLPAKDLAANGTATFDLRKLISEQKPDNQGNVIPLSTTGGQFHWSIFKSPPSSKFIGRSEVVSVSNHVSSSYSCPACCPESGPFGSIIPPEPMFVGDVQTVSTTHGTVYDCNNYPTDMGPLFMDDFGIDDPSIASYSPDYGGSTDLVGLSAGGAYLSGSWSQDIWESDGWSQCFESRPEGSDSQPVDVKPKISSISPSRGVVGLTISVTIQGSGFASGSTVDVAGTGVTASVQSSSSTSLTVNLDVAANATAGNHAVTVTVNGSTSNGVNFFVQIPTSLSLSIGSKRTHNGGSITDCQGTVLVPVAYGYSRLLTYTVLDQSGAAITQTGMTATEQVYLVSSFPAGSGGDFTKSVPVGADGTFCDVQALYHETSPAPVSGEYIKSKQLLNITVPGRLDAVRVNCLNAQYNDVTITDTTSNPNATCQ